MSILNNYNLTFVNRTFTHQDGEQINRKSAFQNVTSQFEPNGFLGCFLQVMRGDIDDVLADINLILSWGFYDEEYVLHFGLDILYVEYTANSMKFYTKFEGDFIQEIPFTDMIQILQLWKTFNQTPPLHNQLL